MGPTPIIAATHASPEARTTKVTAREDKITATNYTCAMQDATRQELRTTIQLAWPVVLTQVSVMTMGMVDMIMVGRLGHVELGAVGLGNSIFVTIAISAAGVLIAMDALVGQRFGEGNKEQCANLMWQGYWISLCIGGPLTLLFLDAAWMAELLGQTPAVSESTGQYLDGRAWSTAFVMLFSSQRAFLSGIGNTRAVFYIALVTNLVNVLADWVLIYGKFGAPALGVEGAGYATSISQLTMFVLAVFVIHRKKYRAHYPLAFRWPDKATNVRILRIGVPFSGHLFVEIGGFAAGTVIAGWISELALAAHQVTMTLASFTFMIPLGIGSAASIRVAQQVGAGDNEGAHLAGGLALKLGVGSGVLAAIAFIVVPESLAWVFSDDLQVIRVAAMLLVIAGMFQIFDSLQVVAAGCLRGTGDTQAPFFANLVAHWFIGLPLGYLLSIEMEWGVAGIWVGFTAALALVGITMSWRFLRGGWRERGHIFD
jgi:MATE family multidrug resistance protein